MQMSFAALVNLSICQFSHYHTFIFSHLKKGNDEGTTDCSCEGGLRCRDRGVEENPRLARAVLRRGGEADAASFEDGTVFVGGGVLVVIDLTVAPEIVLLPADRQETEHGFESVGAQGEGEVGDAVVQQVGPAGRPAYHFTGDLDGRPGGLEKHADPADCGVDIVQSAGSRGAGCRKQGGQAAAQQEMFGIHQLVVLCIYKYSQKPALSGHR